ncbi:hypothetical protein sortregn_29 [Escherichia phage sortregn]|uniref:Uncharacterized protein n=1 Tax=Salmonella phage Lumpael TaxID=2488859 RepID=A0A3G8F5T5_9CAUD|nr:hypothetical protein HOU68_gp02 [Salmonella phage Lumpael]AZF88749.1 hypothetical protein [Salmonella phage Lumpael]QHR68051.1 hypothetical protein sortregn_29 [Escherichia phage sortregn]
MAMDKDRRVGRTKAEAQLLKLKLYKGPECKVHGGNFTRYTSNGACVLCRKLEADTTKGKSRGYIAKKRDTLAFNHPVSPWPITAENMHLCPDLSFKRT